MIDNVFFVLHRHTDMFGGGRSVFYARAFTLVSGGFSVCFVPFFSAMKFFGFAMDLWPGEKQSQAQNQKQAEKSFHVQK